MNFSYTPGNTDEPLSAALGSYVTVSCPEYVSGAIAEGSTDQRSRFYVSAVLLALFTVVVVLGNSLVIVAVLTTRKLRTCTNNFIVSLAFADLLVGVMVLPFSGIYEVSLPSTLIFPSLISTYIFISLLSLTISLVLIFLQIYHIIYYFLSSN